MFGSINRSFVEVNFDFSGLVKADGIYKLLVGDTNNYKPKTGKLKLEFEDHSLIIDNIVINAMTTQPEMHAPSYFYDGSPITTDVKLQFARLYNSQPRIVKTNTDEDTLEQIQALVDKLNAKGTKVKTIELVDANNKEVKIIPKNAWLKNQSPLG